MPDPYAALISLLGAENVRKDDESRVRAVRSWSPPATKARLAGLAAALPDAVALPADADEAAALVRWANGAGARLLPVGGGSNAVGLAIPESRPRGGVVAVDLSRLNAVRWDEESLLAHAGAGVVLGALEERLGAHGYTLGHYLQSRNLATVGGAVATDAVGLLSGRYGRQRDLTVALEAVLPTGEIIRTGAAPGARAAFDLHDLLLGSEGAFGIVTEATLRMRPTPAVRAWAAFTFPSFADGADALRLVYRSDSRPAAARLLDAASARPRLEAAGIAAPRETVLLLLAFEGDELVQTGPYQVAYAVCQRAGGAERPAEIGEAWFEDVLQQTDRRFAANARPGGVADVLALAAPWSAVKTAEAAVRRAVSPLVTALDVQLAHADETGAAVEVAFEAQAEPVEDALGLYERIVDAGLAAALDSGATVAHHYGVGRTRRDAFLRERGPAAVAALRAIKTALDPNGVLPDPF